MFALPAVPGWDGIHPAMVMFPVALLLASAVLLLAGLFAREAWRAWAGAALVTMLAGTLAAWLAAGSGHAAGQLVDKTPELAALILRHEALGVLVRNTFTALTAVYLVLYLLPVWLHRQPVAPLRVTVQAVFLVAWIVAAGTLARAADAGGRLVHTHGVRALVDAPMANAHRPAPGSVPISVPPPARKP